MLDLNMRKRVPETSASWMQSHQRKGTFILPRPLTGWEKTMLRPGHQRNRKDRTGRKQTSDLRPRTARC
ncbi:hypothetical protein SBA1_700025 [Candidatus Sulfotelmatobacter kueseliae]|uniref:Uncharacterized protein n=1 Tax=Candidatus Sulfotelmatobacter kueseliae TaxID=2042962 RepID=A0A2U3L549_9BACT|nr:hypothetical protein SBA1_700025 [Candidatus Sulfotelmatobacter kueseliae]